MSIKPLFTSAPRMKLRATSFNEDGTSTTATIAYAIGLNVNVSIDVQPVFTIGSISAVSLEPTLYNVVTGTLQIVKLSRKNSRLVRKAAVADEAFKKSRFQEDLASNARTVDEAALDSVAGQSVLHQGDLHKHLNPDTVLLSKTFDLEIWINSHLTDGGNGQGTNVNLATDANGAPLNTAAINDNSIFKIKDCRITSRNVNVALGQLINEPLNFQGLLLTPFNAGTELFAKDAGVTEQV